MLALLFEVKTTGGGYDRYLQLAADLRPVLDKHDGMLFIDRFASVERPDTILSHSLWRDEASLAAWRTQSAHHRAQVLGRESIFVDYRLRVAQVIVDRSRGKADKSPARLTSYRDTAVHAPRYLLVAESQGASAGVSAGSFVSLNRPGEHLYIESVAGHPVGEARALELMSNPAVTGVRLCEVERDYGMFDRAEAPQYYPPVDRPAPAPR
jgi:heme-degrading monooxygenase HmoA